MRFALLTLVSLATLAAPIPADAATAPYVITDLGTLAGPNAVFEPGSVATHIHGATIAGYSVTALAQRNFHAYRRADGVMTDLGVYGDDQHSMAFGANAAGDVVGVSYKLGKTMVHGVLWPAAGGMVLLGQIEPRDINSSGAIAGSANVPGEIGVTHASLIVGGVTTDLGTLGGPSSMAMAINDSNWVVGDSSLVDGKLRGFVWRNGTMLKLGTLGGAASHALDIDGLNIVGISDTAAGMPHATLWTMAADGSLVSKTDLGTIAGASTSAAYGINATLTVVGISGDAAFRWRNGTMVDLNSKIPADSGWHLTRAWSVDDDGRIVGVGKHHGLIRAFLLTPRAPADLTADGVVDSADIAILLGAWGTNDPSADLDGDGTVDASDLAILLGAWS